MLFSKLIRHLIKYATCTGLLLLFALISQGRDKDKKNMSIFHKHTEAPKIDKKEEERQYEEARKKLLEARQKLVLSDSVLNEIGIDSLMSKIENVHNTLNHINSVTSQGYDTRDIDANLPEIDSNINIIGENLSLYNSVLDVKNLQMFDVLLADLQDQLNDWRTSLFKYNKELLTMDAEMAVFKRDTILKALMADSAFRNLYMDELNDLKSKWVLAKTSTRANLTMISDLQAHVSNEYFETIDLQNKVADQLRRLSIKSMGKEYPYLWDIKDASMAGNNKSAELARKSYHGHRKILHYYFRRNWDDRAWMLLTGIAFFVWVFFNYRFVEKNNKAALTSNPRPFKFIKKVSILATLVVLFNIAPIFDIHPPSAYVESMELLLVITLTLLLWRDWPRKMFYYWLGIGALYVAFSLTGLTLTPGIGFRIWLLILNIISCLFGLMFFSKIRMAGRIPLFIIIKIVTIIFILLNFSSVVCNLFGRLSLAKIFSITAIFGLTQIIGLSIFIQIVNEAFQLQAMAIRNKDARISLDKVEKFINRLLIILSIAIWVIVFTISLNIYNYLFEVIVAFLTKPRKMGSLSFQIGNLLLFFAIIYISNLLQKGVGSLFRPTETDWDPAVKKNGSRLAMTRLVLLLIGFLIAVAASGLPVDKITIVLGALSVGIGLGLQTIVNNFVSGIVLIFEQPFRIGDFIELDTKKGRVLDIGIRSSKLLTEEGAEIIMPNADLLSGRVINWTLHNDNIRVEIPLTIEPGHKFEDIKQVITEVLTNNQHVMKGVPFDVLLTSATDKGMLVNVQVWVNNVHKLQSIKSELLTEIHSNLLKNGMKII